MIQAFVVVRFKTFMALTVKITLLEFYAMLVGK
jgi:hypothetical protein